MKCPECGSENLAWEDATRHLGGVVDGRLRQNEVNGIFILGCVDCSETVSVVEACKVTDYLNAQGIREFPTQLTESFDG
jgi:hypothetical protein